MNEKNKIIRKIIPLMAVTASAGGLSAALLEFAGSKTNIWINLIIAFIYIVAGTISGMILTEFFLKKGRDIVSRNQKGEILITSQPAYLISGFAVLTARENANARYILYLRGRNMSVTGHSHYEVYATEWGSRSGPNTWFQFPYGYYQWNF